jgi:hypothetical protein
MKIFFFSRTWQDCAYSIEHSHALCLKLAILFDAGQQSQNEAREAGHETRAQGQVVAGEKRQHSLAHSLIISQKGRTENRDDHKRNKTNNKSRNKKNRDEYNSIHKLSSAYNVCVQEERKDATAVQA